MSLPPEKIGDKGQRFVIRTTGWPDREAKGWQNAGYADTPEGAQSMANAFGKCPGVDYVSIKDRKPTT